MKLFSRKVVGAQCGFDTIDDKVTVVLHSDNSKNNKTITSAGISDHLCDIGKGVYKKDIEKDTKRQKHNKAQVIKRTNKGKKTKYSIDLNMSHSQIRNCLNKSNAEI